MFEELGRYFHSKSSTQYQLHHEMSVWAVVKRVKDKLNYSRTIQDKIHVL